MGVYKDFFRKRNSSGIRKPSDPVTILDAVAEIRESGGSIVDLTENLTGQTDNDAVRKVMGWIDEASDAYPEFGPAFDLPVPEDRKNALMPGKQGRKKKVLTAAQRAAYLEKYGLKAQPK